MATEVRRTVVTGCVRLALLIVLAAGWVNGQVIDLTPPPGEGYPRPTVINGIIYNLYHIPVRCQLPRVYTYPTGGIITDARALIKNDGPHKINGNIQIAPKGCLYIEPGSVLHFAPGYGLRVNGTLIAWGSPDERITLTRDPDKVTGNSSPWPEGARLVDGNRTLDGRLELQYHGKWRGVCTNYVNFTKIDANVTCRSLGFLHGNFTYNSFAKNVSDYILYERPACRGTENDLLDCPGRPEIRMGSHVCDGQQVIGFECEGFRPDLALDHWRGIEFINSTTDVFRFEESKIILTESISRIEYADISYAGVDILRDASKNIRHPMAAISANPHAPNINEITLTQGAHDGLNFTELKGSVRVANSTISHNRGHGMYIETTVGRMLVNTTAVTDNWGDGIKFHMVNLTIPRYEDTFTRVGSFCQANIPSRALPVYSYQDLKDFNGDIPLSKPCIQRIETTQNRTLTVHFLLFEKDPLASGRLKLFDGRDSTNLLNIIEITNGSYPQSITTTGNNLFMEFHWSLPLNRQCPTYKFCLRFLLEIHAEYGPEPEFRVINSSISNNTLHGANIHNMRSKVFFNTTEVSSNNYEAGIRIFQGAGEITINNTRIEQNALAGVNITYSGGYILFNNSAVRENHGYGVITEYDIVNKTRYELVQKMEVVRTEFSLNEWTAFRIGNYCKSSSILVNESNFLYNFAEGIEFLSCNRTNSQSTNFSLAFNKFNGNQRHSILISPMLYTTGIITNNTFRNHEMGAIRFDNGDDLLISRWYADFPVNYNIFENDFTDNSGRYVVNMRLTQATPLQKVFFKFNRLLGNLINETFPGLNPRSRANAVVVISSGGVVFERNWVENPDSVMEVSTHLTDASVKIMATRNWWGTANHEAIYNMLFDRDDRYNLAQIEYHPALQFNRLYENYTTDRDPPHKWQFNRGNKIGGVLEHPGFQTDQHIKVYYVDKDIYVQPGVPLFIQPGTTLVFGNALGMVSYGRLVADGVSGSSTSPVVLTLEQMEIVVENVTATVRLEEGVDQYEGRLEVEIDGVWGTVCNEGWVDANAALACQQLGLTYNPKYSTPRQRIIGRPEQPVHLADIACGEMDLDLTKCKSDRLLDKSPTYCNHSQDVIIRCHPPTWAGITIPAVPKGGQRDETQIRHVIIEKAGLLDASTMEYTPSLRIDYDYHVITNLTVKDGVSDGIDIKFTHPLAENRLESCKIENNLGSGIVTRDTSLEISYTSVTGSGEAGLRFDPSFTELEALHIRNSIHPDHRLDMLKMPSYTVGGGSMVFLVTNPSKLPLANGFHDLELDAGMTYRLTLQILDYNPDMQRENVTIFESPKSEITSQTRKWEIEKDLVDFPLTSASRYLTIRIQASGVISGRLTFTAHSHQGSKLSSTRLYVRNCTFSGNTKGIITNHYNNPSDYKQDLFFRHKNEIFEFEIVVVTGNKEEAMFIPSVTKYGNNDLPSYEEMTRPQKVAVIQYIMKYCVFTRNAMGIVAEHNHVDFANNVWHWQLEHCKVTDNADGGFEMELPRVNDRLEREIHSFSMDNTVFKNNRNFAFTINGYYANVTIHANTFMDNICRLGLIAISGMEKELRFEGNDITSNRGRFMVEFDMDSHSEYAAIVPGSFNKNNIRSNLPDSNEPSGNLPHTYAVAFRGVQNVTANRNLLENINIQYELVAGITALSLENALNVKENWWGSATQFQIKQRIFDFDDWNNFALAEYTPFLDRAEFNAATVPGAAIDDEIDLERLGGRVTKDFTIPARREPYIVYSDLTVMENAILKISSGTSFQFQPNIGILVLGVLEAQGLPYSRIQMGPVPKPSSNLSRKRRATSTSLRFVGGLNEDEGFLELYNTTSKSYNLMCDPQFNEKTAEVVCRELGKETINVEVRFTHLYDHYVYGRPMYFRKEFWANSFYCKGNEDSLEQCKRRINYNLLACVYAANYTFVRCGKRNLQPQYNYWGNIRFAPPSHEETSTIIDDPNRKRSVLEYIDITGAGILHGEKVGAIQATYLAPKVQHLNISTCASNAMDYIAPRESLMASTLNITDNLGYGVNVLVLNGESSHDALSSFQPLVTSSIPYNLFGMVEICRMEKQIIVSERSIIYFKYSHRGQDCVKIITSKSPLNRVSLRFLQINLYHDIFSRNAIEIFDGRAISDESMLAEITADSPSDALRSSYTSTTVERTLVLHMHASPGQWNYGFIAEVVTLPQSGLSYPDSTYHHRVENTVFKDNQDGAILYLNVGEVTPSIFVERCWIENNGVAILNLTSWPAIDFEIQDTRVLEFSNNFVNRNRGGMQLVAKTSSVATRANMNITNNVFSFTTNGEALNITGHHYQRAYVFENDFFNNTAGDFRNVINIEEVLVNFTNNVITNNLGHHVLGAYNAEAVPTEQLYSSNIFVENNATAEFSATVLAGRGKPKIVDNYLVNPLCDFELLAGSKVKLQDGKTLEDTPINATRNWWGSWQGPYINGKIWDSSDDELLKSVIHYPAKPDNSSFLEGRCPAGWRRQTNRCYRYLGGALTYDAAKSFCKDQGGYLAETKDKERFLNIIVRSSQSQYNDDIKVWVYGVVRADRCSSFRGIYVIEEEDCERLMLPFICERDPYIAPPGDASLAMALGIAGGVVAGALVIVIIFVILWCVKSKRREKERFERRESIRSSVRSARSKATLAGFSERGTPTHSRGRSLDNISEAPRGIHLSGVTSAETSTETIDKPPLNDYYFNKSHSTTPESKGGPDSYPGRTDHYVNGGYYNGGSEEDDDEFDDDLDEDERYNENEKYDVEDGEDVSRETAETTATNRNDNDDYRGQAPPPYQYMPPRLENEISSLRNTPTDKRIYSNTSLDDKSVDLSSDRSKSGGSMRTFGSHDSMVRPPPYQLNGAPAYTPSQHSASHGDLYQTGARNDPTVRFMPSNLSADQKQASLPSVAPMYRRREQEQELQSRIGQRYPDSSQPPSRQSPAPFHSQLPNQQTARQSPAPYQQTARQSPVPYQQTARQSPAPYQQTARQSPAPYQQTARQSPGPYQQTARQSPAPYQSAYRQSPAPYQQAAPDSPAPYQPAYRQSPAPYQQAAPDPPSPCNPDARHSPTPYQPVTRQSPVPHRPQARHSPAAYQPPEDDFLVSDPYPSQTPELTNLNQPSQYQHSPLGSPMPNQPLISQPAQPSSARGSPAPRQPLETSM